MGTSTRTKHKGINVSAGGLVWVRRRNGSWWPGRILGLDELPEMCPRSPRVETPVKLLGRKDAIVVWYNLEKSRCVKAFRCGDFDECIKNAKASASQCTKVAVKYACRNDAILHALKIENAHGSNCSHQFCLREGDIIGKVTVESCSTQDFTQSVISFETVNPTNGSREDGFMQKKRRKTPNDSEDDGNEGSRRMRDLDDIGLRSVPIQNSGEHPEVVFSDRDSLSGSDICDSLSNSSPVNNTKGSSIYLRRRYSNVGYHVHERLKRKSRCRSISKVLESTSMVDCSALGNEDIMDVKVGVESLDSVKTNFSRVINTNSDSTGTSCQKDIVSSNVSEDTANDEMDVTVFHGSPELKDNVSSELDIHDTGCYNMPSVLQDDQTEDTHRELLSGAGSDKVCGSKMAFMQSNSKAHGAMCSASVTYHDCVEGGIERNTSKQQHREKRNPQLFGKDIDFEKRTAKFKDYLMNANVLLHGSIMSDGWSQLRNEAIHWKKLNAVAQSLSRNDDSQLTTGILPIQHSHSTTYFPLTGYLFDVHLEVQATYKGDYVPLVSVTSKLNGKAIVGHPITVDVLEDGFCDNLMTCTDLWPRTSSCELYDLQRTESLEPLIDVIVQTHQCGYLSEAMMEAKVCNPTHLPVGLGRLSKLRKCTSLPKRTRKLSSIAVKGELREQERKVALMDNLNSLDTACVPLKIVYKRINEALGC